MKNPHAHSGASHSDLDELVNATDAGSREPKGIQRQILLTTALVWSLFQLWTVSPLATGSVKMISRSL